MGLARLVGLVWELPSWLRDDKLFDVLSKSLLFTLWDRSWRLSRLVAKWSCISWIIRVFNCVDCWLRTLYSIYEARQAGASRQGYESMPVFSLHEMGDKFCCFVFGNMLCLSMCTVDQRLYWEAWKFEVLLRSMEIWGFGGYWEAWKFEVLLRSMEIWGLCLEAFWRRL